MQWDMISRVCREMERLYGLPAQSVQVSYAEALQNNRDMLLDLVAWRTAEMDKLFTAEYGRAC